MPVYTHINSVYTERHTHILRRCVYNTHLYTNLFPVMKQSSRHKQEKVKPWMGTFSSVAGGFYLQYWISAIKTETGHLLQRNLYVSAGKVCWITRCCCKDTSPPPLLLSPLLSFFNSSINSVHKPGLIKVLSCKLHHIWTLSKPDRSAVHFSCF